LRQHSRFVRAGGLKWHVQELGSGPVALLVHGTGASTHSWRSLAPMLAERYRVVAIDLPGHAFTDRLAVPSLPEMARVLAEMLRSIDARPALAVGNSAGAAIVARMALDDLIAPAALVSINGAFLPLPGLQGVVFSPMARFLASSPLAAHVFAWRAKDPAAVRRLIGSTGSNIDRVGSELYGRLVRSPAHVEGTLRMMASWELDGLQRDLPSLHVPLLLLVGTNDGTVPPAEAERVKRLLPRAKLVRMHGLGHLAHEEQPAVVARQVFKFVDGKSVTGA
jgi:magnesium chelatase accessory protein